VLTKLFSAEKTQKIISNLLMSFLGIFTSSSSLIRCKITACPYLPIMIKGLIRDYKEVRLQPEKGYRRNNLKINNQLQITDKNNTELKNADI
jgi:hypothetical protein